MGVAVHAYHVAVVDVAAASNSVDEMDPLKAEMEEEAVAQRSAEVEVATVVPKSFLL